MSVTPMSPSPPGLSHSINTANPGPQGPDGTAEGTRPTPTRDASFKGSPAETFSKYNHSSKNPGPPLPPHPAVGGKLESNYTPDRPSRDTQEQSTLSAPGPPALAPDSRPLPPPGAMSHHAVPRAQRRTRPHLVIRANRELRPIAALPPIPRDTPQAAQPDNLVSRSCLPYLLSRPFFPLPRAPTYTRPAYPSCISSHHPLSQEIPPHMTPSR